MAATTESRLPCRPGESDAEYVARLDEGLERLDTLVRALRQDVRNVHEIARGPLLQSPALRGCYDVQSRSAVSGWGSRTASPR